MGVVLIVRLEIMAEARLDVQALRLIEVCFRVIGDPANLHYFEEYMEEIVYIRDIYFILLVRTKNSVKVYKEVSNRMPNNNNLNFTQISGSQPYYQEPAFRFVMSHQTKQVS